MFAPTTHVGKAALWFVSMVNSNSILPFLDSNWHHDAPNNIGWICAERHRPDHALVEDIRAAKVHTKRLGDEVDLSSDLESLDPMCFSWRIRIQPFLERFRITNGISTYDDTAKPGAWLANYLIACNIGGGNEHVARSLPFMMEGSARAWLNNLPVDNIYDRDDLRDAFLKNFEGRYTRSNKVSRSLELR